MSDRPVPTDLPETPTVDRRELLRTLLGSAAAVVGVAAVGVAAVGSPGVAHAAAKLPVCTTRDFRANERDKKAMMASGPGRGTMEQKVKKDHRERLDARYAVSGPAPIWIDVDGLELIEAEVEQSSIDTSDDGSCTVTMDLRLDTLGKGNVKEAVAQFSKLLPAAYGKDSPFLTVTWGVEGDQLFEGFLEKTLVAYDLFLPDATPVRALIRATFLLA